MVGDPKQCQSIEAGPVIDLLRQAVGEAAVPQILTSIRQKTEREREITSLFRAGRAAEALEMKQQDGTAILVAGGHQATVLKMVSHPTADRVRPIRRQRGEPGADQRRAGGFGRRTGLRRRCRNCSPYCRTIAAAGFSRMPTAPRSSTNAHSAAMRLTTSSAVKIGGMPRPSHALPHLWFG